MSTKKYRIRLTTDEQQELKRYLQKVCKQSGGVPSL